MKIERNETYDILGISKNELEWLNNIISDNIEIEKFNGTIIDAIGFRNQIESILYGDKR